MEHPTSTRAAQLSARSQAGMTLLEIMIVLAIIALVMGFLIGPRVYRALKESEGKTAAIIVKKFAHEAYPQWSADNRSKPCPDKLTDLSKYVDNDGKDPWGEEYVMLCGDSAVEGVGFGVMSKGEDKKPNTGDDIKSWAEPSND